MSDVYKRTNTPGVYQDCVTKNIGSNLTIKISLEKRELSKKEVLRKSRKL